MAAKTITLSIELSPANYAYLKAYTDCKPGWTVDNVLTKALTLFFTKESETLTHLKSKTNQSYPVTS